MGRVDAVATWLAAERAAQGGDRLRGGPAALLRGAQLVERSRPVAQRQPRAHEERQGARVRLQVERSVEAREVEDQQVPRRGQRMV